MKSNKLAKILLALLLLAQAERQDVPVKPALAHGANAMGSLAFQGPEISGKAVSEPTNTDASQEGLKPGDGLKQDTSESSDRQYRDPFLMLSAHEAVVKNYEELKSALANDNGITTVYFGGDITMQATGIRIHPNKAHVVIDGINPLEPEQIHPYTLTDYSSATFTDTIYMDTAGTQSLLVRDLAITGKNYYGSFSVYDAVSLAGITITYERVNYNGPQFCHHRRGTVCIVDCTIKIHGGNGGSANQECTEVKHLIFEGNNTVDTATRAVSVFWHPLGGTFQVADDSYLILTSPNTSGVYGVFYADGPTYAISIDIGRRAVFDMTIASIVSSQSYAKLGRFTVHEGGAFYLTTTQTPLAPVLRMEGALTVKKEAKWILSAYGGSTAYAVLAQNNGDITVDKDATFHLAAYHANWCLLNVSGRALKANDPSSVLFYNAGRNIRAMYSAGTLDINAQQVNVWDTLSDGTLDDPPLYQWTKPDQSNFVFIGALTEGNGGYFTLLSSNYTPGDPPGTAPNADTFNMAGARVISFGRLAVTIIEPTTKSTAISGVTEPGATVRAFFTQHDTDYTLPDVTADSKGVFSIPVAVALEEGAVITVKSNWQYLTNTARAVVGSEGKLAFFAPDFLEFFTVGLSASAQTVRRLCSDWEITVSDTRDISEGWHITARLGRELTASTGRPALDGALVFVDASGEAAVMRTDADIVIERHDSVGREVFSLVWEADKGILLAVQPGTAFSETTYKASILWTLVDGP